MRCDHKDVTGIRVFPHKLLEKGMRRQGVAASPLPRLSLIERHNMHDNGY
jgi:hypothetical protein